MTVGTCMHIIHVGLLCSHSAERAERYLLATAKLLFSLCVTRPHDSRLKFGWFFMNNICTKRTTLSIHKLQAQTSETRRRWRRRRWWVTWLHDLYPWSQCLVLWRSDSVLQLVTFRCLTKRMNDNPFSSDKKTA